MRSTAPVVVPGSEGSSDPPRCRGLGQHFDADIANGKTSLLVWPAGCCVFGCIHPHPHHHHPPTVVIVVLFMVLFVLLVFSFVLLFHHSACFLHNIGGLSSVPTYLFCSTCCKLQQHRAADIYIYRYIDNT